MPVNGGRVRQLRLEKKLSIRQLAELAGVAKSQISDIENSQHQNTTIDTICKLAKALECKTEELYWCD